MKVSLLLPRARERAAGLWAALAAFLEQHHDEGDVRQLVLQITRGSRAQPDWSQLEVAWENADLALADVVRNLERVSVGLSGLDETQVDGLDTLVTEVASSIGVIGDIRDKLRSFVAHPEENRIMWMTQDSRGGEFALNAAPLEVGELLQERLFSQKESVVLTSATMSTQGSFSHITERLGLEDSEELLVDSPFDYPKSVLLCVPRDMPDPTNGGYRAALQQALIDICRAADGRTMGLFTSHASLQTARSGIKDCSGAGGVPGAGPGSGRLAAGAAGGLSARAKVGAAGHGQLLGGSGHSRRRAQGAGGSPAALQRPHRAGVRCAVAAL